MRFRAAAWGTAEIKHALIRGFPIYDDAPSRTAVNRLQLSSTELRAAAPAKAVASPEIAVRAKGKFGRRFNAIWVVQS